MHCKQKTTTEKYKKDTAYCRKTIFQHTKGYISYGKKAHITLQKDTFQKAKGCLLRYKRAHIMLRKDIF